MDKNNAFCHPFPNIGYLTAMLTDEELAPVRNEISEIMLDYDKATKANHTLAGNIKKEFTLIDTKEYLEKLIIPYLIEYNQTYEITKDITNIVLPNNRPHPTLRLISSWVNFQEKTEFNPIHHHHGLFSFVIWSRLPFKTEDEKNRTPEIPKEKNFAGFFQFYYTDVLGDIKTLDCPADETYQNTLLVFPAQMKHGVLPFFTSEEKRITISGNFGYDFYDTQV